MAGLSRRRKITRRALLGTGLAIGLTTQPSAPRADACPLTDVSTPLSSPTGRPVSEFSLLAAAQARCEEVIATTGELVRCESPSRDLAAVKRSATLVARLGEKILGSAGEVIEAEGVAHVRWRFGTEPVRVLVLAHHDTVWPVGTLERIPWSTNGGQLRGPGCVDMKAGLAQGLYALAMLRDSGVALSGLSLLVTGDEETGSATSRELIRTEAGNCDAVFVLESAGTDGALKTGRKGPSRYKLEVHGKAAHAGLEPEKGANASVELAHQILAAVALTSLETGTTVTPTLVQAGASQNTVPDRATCSLDARAWTVEEQRKLNDTIHAFTTTVPGCSITVTGGPSRPPMEPATSAALFSLAQTIAQQEGLPEVTQESVGGASDGNITAGMGIPTLDGIGAVGGDAHADNEHVTIESIPARTALLAGLLAATLQPTQPLTTQR
ncbi:M20 family metallopeptidase [Plantibacter sp. YIM 135249]|uniref:M20 family metallopeptidase n=1 Tax=Plantibacter sp. YIM 135249 TaxID=3423918 RepID=UPI003D3424F9